MSSNPAFLNVASDHFRACNQAFDCLVSLRAQPSWRSHCPRRRRQPQSAGSPQAQRAVAWALPEGPLRHFVERLPETVDLLLRRPAPKASLARQGGGLLLEVPNVELPGLSSCFDCVVDVGDLEQSGLVMDLAAYRWDVLGKVEEALRSVSAALQLLRPRQKSQYVASFSGDPVEYLSAYLSAFPVEVREWFPSDNVLVQGTADDCCDQWRHPRIFVASPLGETTAGAPKVLEAVLDREVFAERSHRRYAEILDAELQQVVQSIAATAVGGRLRAPLRILDVGGGDGHMAEWWAASGHDIHVLEVDQRQASAARERIGADRVTFHDGVSPWPHEDDSFDVCLLLFVLHHVHPEVALRRLLKEAARVARWRVLVLEDQPRAAATGGLTRLAAAVTAEHFRPFGQDPRIYMQCVRQDTTWRELFCGAGLVVDSCEAVPGTLQHPVPHTFYRLVPHASSTKLE